MKAGWEPKQLGNAVTLVMGQAPAGTDCNRDGNGTPFVKVGEFGETRPIFREWTTDPKKLARSTDVLICVVGATCGKINLGADCAIGRSVAAIRPKPDKIDQLYLWYFMQGKVQEMRQGSQGAAQTVINREMINALQIPLPPLDEQRRIVAVLDKAFANIATATENAQKNLTNARALFESYLQAIFGARGDGWSDVKLGQICKLISGQHIDANDYNVDRRGIGYLTGPSDFGGRTPVITKWTEHPKRTAESGDILITVKGSGVGKINFLDIDNIAISRQLMAVRAPKEMIGYIYNFLLLKFEHFQSLANGAAIPGISRDDVLDLELSLPPTKDLKAIVDVMDDVSALCSTLSNNAERKLAALTELKQSLLQKAFAGELT